MAELLGQHAYQLDGKGRLSLPTRFRDAFAEGCYLTLGEDGACLYGFPKQEWDRRAGELGDPPLSDDGARFRSRMFFAYAEQVEPDRQGRITIPLRLRQKAGIGQEVVLVGVMRRVEIWDRAAWERYEQTAGGAYQAGVSVGGRQS